MTKPNPSKNIESIYPLSPMQQGILFEELLNPGVYFIQTLNTLVGDLREASFQEAWKRVIERHSSLRTVFNWERRETPLQVVCRAVKFPWASEDWRGLSNHEQEVRLADLLRKDRRQGFELSQAPPMRLMLIRMDESRYELIWSFHQLLLDGWSMSVVFGEVLELYEAIADGRVSALPDSRPYRDYISWLQQQSLAKAEAYWRKAVDGITAPTCLGRDGIARVPSTRVSPDEMRNQDWSYSLQTFERIKGFCKQRELTLNTLVQFLSSIQLNKWPVSCSIYMTMRKW